MWDFIRDTWEWGKPIYALMLIAALSLIWLYVQYGGK